MKQNKKYFFTFQYIRGSINYFSQIAVNILETYNQLYSEEL